MTSVANPTSTTDPNRFVSVFNTFKEDVLNSVPLGGLENVFLVPEAYETIQSAIDAAVAAGHDQQDPAIVSITPDSSYLDPLIPAVADAQFAENITIYDGIYVMSAVPNKKVCINGTLSLGSTALGTDDAGNTNDNVRYILRDLFFVVAGAGAAILNATTALNTRIDMIRVDMANLGGTGAGDVCVTIDAASVYAVNLDQCVWTNSGSDANNYCLSMGGGTQVVTANNRCQFICDGTATVNSVVVDDAAWFTAYDSDFRGLIYVGNTILSYLSLRRCQVSGNVVAGPGEGLIVTGAANVAHEIVLEYCHFVPIGHDGIVQPGNSSNIIYGANCSWDGSTTALVAIASAAISTSSYWEGGPTALGSPGTASFTWSFANYGQTMVLPAGTSNPSVILLPAPASNYAGAHFKVVAKVDLSGTSEWRVSTNPGATLDISFVDSGGAAGLGAIKQTAIQLAGVYSASPAYVEVSCDGTTWHAKGQGLITGTTVVA